MKTSRRIAVRMEELKAEKKEAERLLRAERPHWRKNRRRALTLDNQMCRMCGFTLCLDVHHVIPVSEGGSDSVTNLITLCPNHHAMAHRGLLSSAELARCLFMRTSDGRMRAKGDLLGELARDFGATKGDPQKIEQFYCAMVADLPRRLSLIYGFNFVKEENLPELREIVINASRGFSRPTPLDDVY